MVAEAVSVEAARERSSRAARSSGTRRAARRGRRTTAQPTALPRHSAAPSACACSSAGAVATRPALPAATRSRPGRHARRPGDHRRGPGDDRGRSRGWRAAVTATRDLLLDPGRTGRRRAPDQASGTDADPVLLEVFSNLFMAIAEQMGVAPASRPRTPSTSRSASTSPARSSTRTGSLIANAPHIPVHLGSMGESIKNGDEPQRGAALSRATCTRSTTRTAAAPTCPTSPW